MVSQHRKIYPVGISQGCRNGPSNELFLFIIRNALTLKENLLLFGFFSGDERNAVRILLQRFTFLLANFSQFIELRLIIQNRQKRVVF